MSRFQKCPKLWSQSYALPPKFTKYFSEHYLGKTTSTKILQKVVFHMRFLDIFICPQKCPKNETQKNFLRKKVGVSGIKIFVTLGIFSNPLSCRVGLIIFKIYRHHISSCIIILRKTKSK